MASYDYTQAQLTAIRRAIASGELTVQWGDRARTFRSMDDLIKAEERILQGLTAAAGGRAKQFIGVASKGLD